MDQTNYYSYNTVDYTADYTSDYQGAEWQGDATQGNVMQGDAMQGEYASQEGYYDNYNTAGNEDTKSVGTPTYDEPEEANEDQRGEKRAAEENSAGNSKRAKDKAKCMSDNPVQILNQKMPALEYKCVDISGEVHDRPSFTMQITVGGQVFEAEGRTKKQAKMLVAQAALQHIADTNMPEGQVLYRRPSKNPSTILNDIRPNTKFEFLEEIDEGNNLRYYRMKCIVDGEEYEAKGRSKHLAKSYAAMAALQQKFNLEFTVPDFEQMPTFDGNDQEWQKYKKVKEPVLFEGRSPTQEIHSMYRPLDFDISGLDVPTPTGDKYKCTLKIENVIFIGTGTSRNSSKVNACVEALNWLKAHGMLEQKRAEAEAAREQRVAMIKAEHQAAEAAQQTQSG